MCSTFGSQQPDDSVKIMEIGSHHYNDHSYPNPNRFRPKTDTFSSNTLMAERNRGFLKARQIMALNLVSSPGSGKTSILERTIQDLGGELDFLVIVGDQQTSNDAERIDATSAPVVKINIGKGGHLDADMVHKAIHKLQPTQPSVLMIENAGHFVCPSLFDLGENQRVVIMSVTEGEDKPIKYPDLFYTSHLCIISKIDLLPYVRFDIEKAKEYARKVNHHLEFIALSATTGEGMADWYNWLSKKAGQHK